MTGDRASQLLTRKRTDLTLARLSAEWNDRQEEEKDLPIANGSMDEEKIVSLPFFI